MRAVRQDDLEPLRLMHNDPDTLAYLSDPTPVTPETQQEWYAGIQAGRRKAYVIEDTDGRLLAFVRVSDWDEHNWTACIGLDVVTGRRGQGWGEKCYDLLLRWCFEEQGLEVVWLQTADFNARARRLYEKVGFKRHGEIPQGLYRHGRRWDLLILAMTKEEWRGKEAMRDV